MSILGFDMKVKVADGYAKLNPSTSVGQIFGFEEGFVYGPYDLTLTVDGWVNGEQTLALADILATDIPFVGRALSGTTDEMKSQDIAFKLLDTYTGVESLDGQIKFTTTTVPDVDYTVQVWWTR